jgi:hypothetical protein
MSKNEKGIPKPGKNVDPHDKQKLASGHRKKKFEVVTIIFEYFLRKSFRKKICKTYMVMNDNKKQLFSSPKYHCDICDYFTSKMCNINDHFMTRKHQTRLEMIKKDNNDNENQQKPADMIICECGKNYKHKSGLSRHKKVCNFVKKNTNNDPTDKELVVMLLKENNELKKMVLDVCKNVQPVCSINNSNIVNNKTFCLNFFLNEHCKDAMNIMEFVDSLKLQLTDLETVGDLGFVDGLSNIIVQNLKALDITKRPVHCSDLKREVLYVRDENKWEKENEEKIKLKKAIKYVANKNIKLITEWKDKHPDCIFSNSKNSDKYNKIVLESMGGKNHDTNADENKIIKYLAREVTINKDFI